MAQRVAGLMSKEAAREWLAQCHLPTGLQAHLETSARVAAWIARRWPQDTLLVPSLQLTGQQRVQAAYAAALLHDCGKSARARQLFPHLSDHGERGAAWLEEVGFDLLVQPVRRHPVYTLGTGKAPASWLDKLVFYADKRAESSGLVTVEQRLAGMQERHPRYADELAALLPLVQDLESALFTVIDSRPTALKLEE